MNMRPTRRALSAVATLAISAGIGAAAVAQTRSGQPSQQHSSSALISEQLDKLVKLQLNQTPLPQVLKTIENQTGVPVRVTEDVYDVLPWGTQTPITATVENLTLRDALIAIGGKLGLQSSLRDEFVELSPHPALRRMGRRVTLQELATLDVLASRPLDTSRNPRPDVVPLTRWIDEGLAAYDKEQTQKQQRPSKIVVELRSTDGVDPDQSPVILSRGMTLLDGLEAIANQTKLTWYPWGDSVVVLPKRDVMRGLLDRAVTLRYDGADVTQVLVDLSRRAGVPFMIEPGAIQRVTPEFRIVSLAADSTVRQALESLQGYTGLSYQVTDAGVYIWNQNSSPTGSTRGRVVGMVEVSPGTSVVVTEDQLSPAAREAITARRMQAAQQIEQALAGPSATTQPTHEN